MSYVLRWWRVNLAIFCFARTTLAAEGDSDTGTATGRAGTTAEQVPQLSYVREAFGSSPSSVGAAALGMTRFGGAERTAAWYGGGLRAWGSPVDRLTLFGQGARRDNGEFAPSVGAQVRILGDRRDHYAIAASGQYVAEGFAELEGEVEVGLLASYANHRVHLDANAIVGAGLEEDEMDGELLARVAYDVFDRVRLGVEGRARQRLGGEEELAGGQTRDGFLGLQTLLTHDPVFFTVTFGPNTIGIKDGIGWCGIVSAGGVAF